MIVEAVISMVFGSFLVSIPCCVKIGRSELPLVGSFCCHVEGAIETMRVNKWNERGCGCC